MDDELKHFEKMSYLIYSMGITEPTKTSFQFGVEAEQERIIKLLESIEGHGWIEIQFDKLIELIKGETN